ncbi:hypothetical protein PMAA_102290 [Paecilomyces variotii No. 5]|uniref:Aminoglycoside phosphotransferase domain-containing protein n=1 Tax=Byssochlamys spectabilis (strain No. 5 / NBRC 109023) TaxID=1356009 RepID=V5I2S5_BYSSN|nr:hypothetical protein PMAA_102290 [Paecilomyces variotii No. 5]
MANELQYLSDDDIVRLCPHADAENGGCSLEKISGNVLVKYGWSVTNDEAANQIYAYTQSQGTKIRVPEVYRYFQKSGIGYLVMEFIDGIPLADLAPWDNYLMQDLAQACYRDIILSNGSFCLLDWEFAGFYPRVFEKYCILFIGQKEDYGYANDLADSLDSIYRKSGLDVDDEHLTGLLNRVYKNNLNGGTLQIDWEAVKGFNVHLENPNMLTRA